MKLVTFVIETIVRIGTVKYNEFVVKFFYKTLDIKLVDHYNMVVERKNQR